MKVFRTRYFKSDPLEKASAIATTVKYWPELDEGARRNDGCVGINAFCMHPLGVNLGLRLEESVASHCVVACGCPWLNWSTSFLDFIIELILSLS